MDTDGDGVGDNADRFPNDPNESADSDNDGVGDNSDDCPATPAGETVDMNGCSASQRDSDGDGVSDAEDAFPFDPTEPWTLQLLVQRATGPLDKAFTTFGLRYIPPEQYIETTAPAVAASAVAHAQAELGEDAGLNDLVRVALKRAAG